MKPHPDTLVICRQHQLDELTAKRARVRELSAEVRQLTKLVDDLRQTITWLENQIDGVKCAVINFEGSVKKCLPNYKHYCDHMVNLIKRIFWQHDGDTTKKPRS